MVPWSVILLVLGEWKRGVAFLAVWGVICLFRRMIEPKIVGDQTGLHPLLSLLAIYVGMKLGGVVAMILAPVLLLMLRNLWRAGCPRHRPGPHHGGPGYGGHPPWQTGGDRPARARKTRRNRSKNGEKKVKSFSTSISRNLHKYPLY